MKYDAFLPKGAIFSIMDEEHLKQAIVVFKLLYFAKDWTTLRSTIAWVRHHLNERLSIYAISVAIIHRPDIKGIILPPIYEIIPNFFFNDEIIHKASILKQTFDDHTAVSHSQAKEFTIHSNYSGWYLNLHPEQSMSYYLEDIEMNAHYYHLHLWMPFWMDSEEFKLETHSRGEIYLKFVEQLLARWNMERFANGFSEVKEVDFHSPIDVSYTPSLAYANGLSFPSRPPLARLQPCHRNYREKWMTNIYSYSWTFLRDYANRIEDVADGKYALAVSIFRADISSFTFINHLLYTKQI